MDTWAKVAFAVLLPLLKDRREANKAKPAFLKLWTALWMMYGRDPAFRAVVQEILPAEDVVE